MGREEHGDANSRCGLEADEQDAGSGCHRTRDLGFAVLIWGREPNKI